MKKLLILAIAAAIAAPMAASAGDTVLYGKINNSLIRTDASGSAHWDVIDASSRVGIKASEDLGSGLTAVLQIELKLDSDTGNGLADGGRLAYVGLAGGFGAVALGQQWTPYYGAVNKTDIFSIPGANDHYLSNLDRSGDTLSYVSPNIGGVTVKLAAIVDGATDEDGVDAWDGSIGYKNAGLDVALGIHRDATTDADYWGIGGQYSMGDFAVIGQYESRDNSTEDQSWGIGGTATFGSNVAKIVYGNEETGSNSDATWSLGMDHNFSKRTKVFVEYHATDIGTDTSAFGVGMQHVF